MMKLHLSSAAVIFLLLADVLSAQPIKTPYVFVQSGSDTIKSSILPEPQSFVQRVSAADGHFWAGDKKDARIRFFGTELEWTSQFMSGADAHALAKRLHKLGFNAVRLVDNDFAYPYYSYPQGSFLDNTNKTTSYNLIQLQLAKFDTLIYEFKKQGIYAFLVLNSVHYYLPGDGVAQWDTIHGYGQFVHFIDNRASELHRLWAKTLLTHVNPLTGLTLGNDPAIAAVEVTSPGLSLLAGWRYGYLNWIDENNVLTKGGASTIGWNRSRRLDSLYSQYLLHKYGSDAGINNAWAGPALPNPPNLIANGSFEQVGSTAWSFAVQNGATGGQSIFSPAPDSQYCMLVILSETSSNPNAFDAFLQNSTARLGKDSLYELSFYAKIHYDATKPVVKRSILVYLAQYQTGAVSLSASQMIDTSWTKYTFTFRAAAGNLQTLYLGVGQQLGDVMFDAVSIKRKQEYGLFPGESSTASSIVRIKFGESDLLPHQRVRDQVLFYDSLQTDYFTAMKKCIADTIKSPVLVNCYTEDYWSTIQDCYSNRVGDFAQGHINSDYPRARDQNHPYSDSTWVMSNTSLLNDLGNYTMGSVAASSIAGKPFIARYMNLITNQHGAATVPFFTAYASLQDWDGLFFDTYATYYEDLFANVARAGSWWNIAGDPSLLVQMPQASDAFRNQKIMASTAVDTIYHQSDDVLLESVPGKYQHPFGVEGYLDPNIATQDLVRQKFDSPVHKVAAEYPYLSDTAKKISSTNQLLWSQTGGYFIANANGFSAATGIFGGDTVRAGNLRFRRLDDGGDLQSVLLTQLTPSTMLLTAASRSQNSREVWQYHDSSIGNHWGIAPTIMSAGKFEFFITSDSNRVVAHPLDMTGNVMGSIEGIKMTGTNTFKIAIDQSITQSPWFYIESNNNLEAVPVSGAGISDVMVIPNPAKEMARIKLTLAISGVIRISLYDDLGREAANVANGELYQGTYDLPLDLRMLTAGHYTLRVDCGGKVMSRNVNVVR